MSPHCLRERRRRKRRRAHLKHLRDSREALARMGWHERSRITPRYGCVELPLYGCVDAREVDVRELCGEAV